MSAELIEWIVRLSPPVSGDSRKELVSVARAHGWGIREFGRLVADSRLQQPLLEVLRNVELAALCRFWRNDFGDLQAAAVRREGRPSELVSPPRGASPARFSPPHRQGDRGRINGIASPHACGDRREEGQSGQVPLHSTYVAEREARQQERPRSPTSELRGTRSAASRSPPSPTSLFQEELQGLPQVQGLRDLGLSPAYAVAVSLDGGSVYVAGAGGLARFLLPSLELAAHSPYVGRASAPGYAEVVAGQGLVVCADIDGALTEHDPDTCDLRCQRSYQPSVMEQSQRVVGGQLRRFTESVCGLEGGFGGAPRLAAAGSTVYLGGRDGVMTAYGAGTLNVLARCRLCDGAQSLGIRAVAIAPASRRLYCAVLSTLHVLALPALRPSAKLRGGPRVPVFGSFCSLAESEDGSLAFAGDLGGPAVHFWDTATWQWLGRVELSSSGGAACHLTVTPGDWLLCASTDCGRFLSYGLGGRLPPRCVEEGSGGGPMATVPGCSQYVVVLGCRGSQLALRPLDGLSAARHQQ
mmetsp:Transcript_10172/g.35619  ORF Transcript_10172/g.35619 Transcript_10172/m.35619 type:complete len:525 (+) Transcript_10172:106-1680(+)